MMYSIATIFFLKTLQNLIRRSNEDSQSRPWWPEGLKNDARAMSTETVDRYPLTLGDIYL